ncbi:MAG: hypothetical protein ACLQOO_25055 [Terriglobia bacterium]
MMIIKRARVRRHPAPTRRPIVLMVVLMAAALAGWFAPAAWTKPGSHKQPGQHAGTRIDGVLTQVHAAYITLRTDEGKEITLQTREDFRPKVGVGARVQAWYLPGSNGYTLEWLEYPWENFFTSWDEIHRTVKRVAILPVSDVPEATNFFETVAGYLRTNLHWRVPLVSSAATSSTLDAVDPATGQFDIAHYMDKGQATVDALMASAHAQAVLEVDIQAVQATVRDRVASWDGVEEALAAGPKVGEAPATSVSLKLWGDGGKLLWSNHRGFAVLVIASGGRLRDRSLAEVLLNTSGVEDWLNMMFAGLVSGPQSTLP